MKRKRLALLALLAILAAGPALAQDAQPSAAQAASADWQMMLRAQSHVAQSVSAIVAENERLKAEIARRDAEAKKAEPKRD